MAGALRELRERARSESRLESKLPPYPLPAGSRAPLGGIEPVEPASEPRSPDRSKLNEIFDVSRALDAPPGGALGRILSRLRGPLRRVIRFALGPLIERQVEMNSAQVRFDNELVAYVDARLDRMSSHYDKVLGLHGKRMEEIDERHLILQQELIQHVHDLVKRIEFVFETAEQNHLYLEGDLREVRERVRELAGHLETLAVLDEPGRSDATEKKAP